MTHTKPWRIVLAGTGNVAWHLGHAFLRKGMEITQVVGRTGTAVRNLAEELQARCTGEPSDMIPDADVCLICITDDNIRQVLEKLKPGNCLCIHTAGSVSMNVFEGLARNYGVFYPLQTLTRDRPVNYETMPVLIEANNPENLRFIRLIAEQISGRVVDADSRQRLFLHLAAVFAGNFTNHMFSVAERLAQQHGLSFELLNPLMEETTAKAIALSPKLAQTGPASRGNRKIMDMHLSLLHDQPGLQELYRLISESIMRDKGRETRDES